jgi:hypothetical protein
MKFNVNKFSCAASVAMSVMYVACAIYTYVFPTISLNLSASYLLMSNLSLFAPYLQVSLANVVSGLLQTFVFTYITAFIFAWLYNKMGK